MVEYGVFILLVCACLDISYLLFYVVLEFYDLTEARRTLAADYASLNV